MTYSSTYTYSLSFYGLYSLIKKLSYMTRYFLKLKSWGPAEKDQKSSCHIIDIRQLAKCKYFFFNQTMNMTCVLFVDNSSSLCLVEVDFFREIQLTLKISPRSHIFDRQSNIPYAFKNMLSTQCFTVSIVMTFISKLTKFRASTLMNICPYKGKLKEGQKNDQNGKIKH